MLVRAVCALGQCVQTIDHEGVSRLLQRKRAITFQTAAPLVCLHAQRWLNDLTRSCHPETACGRVLDEPAAGPLLFDTGAQATSLRATRVQSVAATQRKCTTW